MSFGHAPPSTANEPTGESNINYRASGVIIVPVSVLGRIAEIAGLSEVLLSYNTADYELYIGSATSTNVLGATDTALVGCASLD